MDAIEYDIRWLGFNWDKLCYGSDYFDDCFEYAVKLIKKGVAYVDDLSKDEMREYRGTLTEPGKNSPYRDRSVEENLDLFYRMRNGEFEDGARTLRAKIDMASPNINMRDPAIYRIKHVPHHHTGTKWCIYPMYDFAHPIQDAIEGITHSLCSLEYEAHRPLYNWVVNCEFEHKPRQIEFARLESDQYHIASAIQAPCGGALTFLLGRILRTAHLLRCAAAAIRGYKGLPQQDRRCKSGQHSAGYADV